MMPFEQAEVASRQATNAVTQTGNAWDVATDATGMMMFRTDDGLRAASSAQLRRDADGRLVDTAGGVL